MTTKIWTRTFLSRCRSETLTRTTSKWTEGRTRMVVGHHVAENNKIVVTGSRGPFVNAMTDMKSSTKEDTTACHPTGVTTGTHSVKNKCTFTFCKPTFFCVFAINGSCHLFITFAFAV